MIAAARAPAVRDGRPMPRRRPGGPPPGRPASLQSPCGHPHPRHHRHRRRHHRRPGPGRRRAGPGGRPGLPGADPALPPARPGRARRRRDLARWCATRSTRWPGDWPTPAGWPGPSASPTSARRWWPGTGAPAPRCTGPSSGRTGGPPTGAAGRWPRPATSPSSGERTGLVLDPYFSATKMQWLLEEGGVPDRPRTWPSAPSTRGCCGT